MHFGSRAGNSTDLPLLAGISRVLQIFHKRVTKRGLAGLMHVRVTKLAGSASALTVAEMVLLDRISRKKEGDTHTHTIYIHTCYEIHEHIHIRGESLLPRHRHIH